MTEEWTHGYHAVGHVRINVPVDSERRVAVVRDRLVSQPESFDDFLRRVIAVSKRHNRGVKFWEWEPESEDETIHRVVNQLGHHDESPYETLERLFISVGAIDDANDSSFTNRIAWLAENFQDPTLQYNSGTLDVDKTELDAIISKPLSIRRLPHYRALRNSLRLDAGKERVIVDRQAITRAIHKIDGYHIWRRIPSMFFGEDPRIVQLLESS